MFNISEYLKKFHDISKNNSFLKDIVLEVIEKFCYIKIEKGAITIKDGNAIVKTRPIIKNEIAIKKYKIMKEVLEKTEGKVTDIILS